MPYLANRRPTRPEPPKSDPRRGMKLTILSLVFCAAVVAFCVLSVVG